MVKESTCQCRRRRWLRRYGFNPRVRKIPWNRKWQPIPVSCWDNPMHRGAWWATVHGVAKRQTWLSIHTHTWCLCILGSVSADSTHTGRKLHTQSHRVELQSPCSYLFCHTATHREVAEFNGNINSAGESGGKGLAVGRDRFLGTKLSGPCSKKRITEVIQAQKMCSLRNEQIAQHLVYIKCLIVNQ